MRRATQLQLFLMSCIRHYRIRKHLLDRHTRDDETVCLFAATFIPVFQRAGWKIDGPNGQPGVERAKLLIPQKEISVVTWGPPKVDPQDPDHGVWTQINPWAQVLQTAL